LQVRAEDGERYVLRVNALAAVAAQYEARIKIAKPA
jgi:hypothetical protein